MTQSRAIVKGLQSLRLELQHPSLAPPLGREGVHLWRSDGPMPTDRSLPFNVARTSEKKETTSHTAAGQNADAYI